MGLAKLSIRREDESETQAVDVMFNPNSYSISKTVAWNGDASTVLNAPLMKFGGGGSRQLSLELFFDVTGDGGKVDVRTHTDRIVQLTRIRRGQESQRPPWCELKWGEEPHMDFPFKGVVTNLDQNFTLFHENGRPLRALLKVTFTEFLSIADELTKTDVPQQSAHIVRPHDTLASISPNPKDWREIAKRNGIENPHHLIVGAGLILSRLV